VFWRGKEPAFKVFVFSVLMPHCSSKSPLGKPFATIGHRFSHPR
jgi:hypothetical protein